MGTVGLALAGIAGEVGAQTTSGGTPPPTRVLDRPGIVHGPVTLAHNGQPALDGYLARPEGPGPYPGVLVIAGNRITEEYIPNTCAALALAGFVGLAPNLYHIVPASAQTNQQIADASANHTEDDVLLDMLTGMNHLRAHDFVRRRSFGVVGFCFGGKIALKLGARSREIGAVVAYHPAPAILAADVAGLAVPTLIHVGTVDRAAPVASIRELEVMLDRQGTPNEVHVYEGADHGFLAYTRPNRYHPAAGALSWEHSAAFLRRHLD